MNFQIDGDDQSQGTLVITNPPVVSLENTELGDILSSLED